jgi:hypothetical protein
MRATARTSFAVNHFDRIAVFSGLLVSVAVVCDIHRSDRFTLWSRRHSKRELLESRSSLINRCCLIVGGLLMAWGLG